MKTVNFKVVGILQLLILVLSFTCINCTGNSSEIAGKDSNDTAQNDSLSTLPQSIQNTSDTSSYKVTFIELGSVRCIPCQQMQPVMKSIEENYKGMVKVIFYDVWTEEGRPFADQYKVQVIPTQVFLDEKGEEFFRHQGFFPEEEIVKLLKTKGMK